MTKSLSNGRFLQIFLKEKLRFDDRFSPFGEDLRVDQSSPQVPFEQAAPRIVLDFERNPFEFFVDRHFRWPDAFAQRDEKVKFRREIKRFGRIYSKEKSSRGEKFDGVLLVVSPRL